MHEVCEVHEALGVCRHQVHCLTNSGFLACGIGDREGLSAGTIKREVYGVAAVRYTAPIVSNKSLKQTAL